jgi:hypothetical protein
MGTVFLVTAPIAAVAGVVVGVVGSATLGWTLGLLAAAFVGGGFSARGDLRRFSSTARLVAAVAGAVVGSSIYLVWQETWSWWVGMIVAVAFVSAAPFPRREPGDPGGGSGPIAAP